MRVGNHDWTSARLMHSPLSIEFLGPYSWHGAPDAPSVFTAPVASQQGIYLWTIALPDGYITYYVGENGRSFALRMAEHFQEHAACMYTLYEPEQFARGTKVKLWPGRWGKEKRSIADCVSQSVVFARQIAATTQLFRFFLATTTCDRRIRQRAESGIADCLYNTPGMIGDFQDKGIRYCRRKETEQPIQFTIRCSSRLLGMPAEVLG